MSHNLSIALISAEINTKTTKLNGLNKMKSQLNPELHESVMLERTQSFDKSILRVTGEINQLKLSLELLESTK
jgi:hypothetical protein